MLPRSEEASDLLVEDRELVQRQGGKNIIAAAKVDKRRHSRSWFRGHDFWVAHGVFLLPQQIALPINCQESQFSVNAEDTIILQAVCMLFSESKVVVGAATHCVVIRNEKLSRYQMKGHRLLCYQWCDLLDKLQMKHHASEQTLSDFFYATAQPTAEQYLKKAPVCNKQARDADFGIVGREIVIIQNFDTIKLISSGIA